MKICARCKKYPVVLEADKTQDSQYVEIAPQSESEEEHWSYMQRWIYVFPLEETDYCYYCTKVLNGRLSRPTIYSFGNEAKQTPVWRIGSSDQKPVGPDLDDRRTFYDEWPNNRPAHSHL